MRTRSDRARRGGRSRDGRTTGVTRWCGHAYAGRARCRGTNEHRGGRCHALRIGNGVLHSRAHVVRAAGPSACNRSPRASDGRPCVPRKRSIACDVLALLGAHQRERVARRVHAAGAADAVHVVLGRVRHVEVDDVRDVVDVDAARGDVGRDQDRRRGRAAGRSSARSRWLCVRSPCRTATEWPRRSSWRVEPVGAVLGAREHDHAVPVVDAARACSSSSVGLEVPRHRVDRLRDAGGRARRRREVEALRIAQRLVRHLVELGRHGRGEHQRLPLLGQQLQDAAQVGREAHVDHAVGLVEHQHLDLVEAHALAAVQVEQAARGRDQQVDALAAQHALLRTDRHAAVDDADPHAVKRA